MNEHLNRSQICRGLVACILLAGILILAVPIKPALAQACDKVGGKIGGAVIGGATGSLIGKKKKKKAATIAASVLGGALGSKQDKKAKARCIEEREVEKDRDMQRQLDYERQSLLQAEQVRKEIEEQRLYEEWKRERLGSSN